MWDIILSHTTCLLEELGSCRGGVFEGVSVRLMRVTGSTAHGLASLELRDSVSKHDVAVLIAWAVGCCPFFGLCKVYLLIMVPLRGLSFDCISFRIGRQTFAQEISDYLRDIASPFNFQNNQKTKCLLQNPYKMGYSENFEK